MVLKNINIIGQAGVQFIRIAEGKIVQVASNKEWLDKDELTIEFNDAIVFPGLINSHDHLEFNLFPKLGNRIYKNYMEWGPDIHKQNKNIISGITKIPRQLRVEWGIYKNLLNGITTVVHHGKYFKIENALIDVFQDCYSLHSVRLEKCWRFKLNWPFSKNWPFVTHAGEGTDLSAYKEINEMIRWNLFKRNLIAVHGVAMDPIQAKAFKGLIWCPDSNLFLFNATASVDKLKNQTKILFGTDSTVSAGWNVWEQIRLARKLKILTDQELFNSLTTTPALVWGLSDKGMLANGKSADMVVVKMKDDNGMNNFFQTNPEDILLVIKNGQIVLFDETLKPGLNQQISLQKFCNVLINNAGKYVKGGLAGLIDQIKRYNPEIKFPVEIKEAI